MVRRGRVAGGPEEETVVDEEPGDDQFFDATLSGPTYRVRRSHGAAGSVGAGVTSALLGIGGGLVKVPVMHIVMGVPLRVATATSNLMMGITASAGAIIYLSRGLIDPYIASPTALGVFVGASLGSRVAHRIDLRILRGLFVAILLHCLPDAAASLHMTAGSHRAPPADLDRLVGQFYDRDVHVDPPARRGLRADVRPGSTRSEAGRRSNRA